MNLADRSITRNLFLIICVLTLTAYSSAQRIVVDESGRKVSVPEQPHRIICLVPSVTDIVYSLGAGSDVVGISDYVQYPAEAKAKPSVGAIDNPSLEAILALHPDLLLGQPYLNAEGNLDKLEQLGIPVFLVDPHGVSGILHSIASIGRATHRETDADAEIARLTRRIDAVRARVQGKAVVSVFMPLSFEPLVTIGKGSFITEIISLAGGHSITDDIQQEWPQIDLEAVVGRAPQALLMMRGGHVTLPSLKVRSGWSTMPAVEKGRAYYVDPRIEFPSPIAISALEDLAKEFHP